MKFIELLKLQNKNIVNNELEDATALLAEDMNEDSFENFLRLKRDSLIKEN
jgi:hypothetical protein